MLAKVEEARKQEGLCGTLKEDTGILIARDFEKTAAPRAKHEIFWVVQAASTAN